MAASTLSVRSLLLKISASRYYAIRRKQELRCWRRVSFHVLECG
jgi:hypothetical protein